MENLKFPLRDGNEIVLIYINSFTWKDEKQAAILHNHPVEGRVYRAVKTKEPVAYYVDMEIPKDPNRQINVSGIRFTNLSYDTPEWTCNLIELSDDNILDYDISDEDYKKIQEWNETDHSSLLSKLKLSGSVDMAASVDDDQPDFVPMKDIIDENEEEFTDDEKKMREEVMKKIYDAFGASIQPYKTNMAENLNKLAMRDPFLLRELDNLTEYIIEELNKEDAGKELSLSREISMSPELGKGANIYSAAYYLDEYLRYSNPECLETTVYYLLLELVRRRING